MAKPTKPIPFAAIESRIRLIRGHKIILDADLAELYGVPTKALNQAVKRNVERFPGEFVFRLTSEEGALLHSQTMAVNASDAKQSQIVTGSQKHRDPRFQPYAFTEHGALMAANVLRSPRAIRMSVVIVQTFVRLQRMAVSVNALARKVEDLEKATQENSDDIKKIVAAIRELMLPPESPQREIGFHARPQEKNPAAKHRSIR